MISFTKNVTIIAVLTFIILASTVEETKSGGRKRKADQLIQQEFDDLNQFDKDGDGKLNFDEFKEMMSSTSVFMSEDEIEKLFNEVDTNHNGTINLDEFKTMVANDYDKGYRNDFRMFDKDKKGYISGGELRELLNILKGLLTEEEIRNFDVDGGGKISFEEYKNLMMSLR